MKYKSADMTFFSGDNDALRRKLQKILSENDMSSYRAWVESVSTELNVDLLDCAAALAYLWQSGLQKNIDRTEKARPEVVKIPKPASEIKMVRYRLDIGKKHKVSVDELKNILVDETGVERKLIGYIDIHNHYTLIRLPEGMPADAFSYLRSLEINKQALNIKRIRGNRTFQSGKRNSFHSVNKKKSGRKEEEANPSDQKGD